MPRSSETIYPRTDDDLAAEQGALESAANGEWESFAQDGFTDKSRQIAVEASAELDQQKEISSQHPQKTTSSQSGFEQSSSGLLVPAVGAKVDLIKASQGDDIIVTDKRRWSPASIEAEDRKRMEELRKPLTSQELVRISSIAKSSLHEHYEAGRKKYSDKETGTEQELQDLDGDIRAFSRLDQIANGESIAWGNDQANLSQGMPPRDRITDLISLYSKYTEDVPHVGSMGGSVQVDPDTHEIHFSGYNNGLLYTFARLGQIWDNLTEDPMRARKALESDKPDFTWLTSGPVIVEVPELVSA